MKIVPTNQAQTLIYVIAPSDVPHSACYALLPSTSKAVENHNLMAWRNGMSTWVLSDTNHINNDILHACDALVVVIDGNIGMSPAIIDVVRSAQDQSLPVHVCVNNSITGRADFDEVLAITQRVIDEDAVARYLPIESDEDEGIAGLFDLLATDLHVLVDGDIEIRSSDPEHVNLTIEKRADIIELLAHFGLSDAQFESMSSGLPVSIPVLEAAFEDPAICKVTPVDDGVARHILTQWQASLQPAWLPTVSSGEDTVDVDEFAQPIGIGIGKDIARYWNSDRAVWLECLNSRSSISDSVDCTAVGGFMWVSDVRQGDTLRPAETDAIVHAPQF